MNKKTQYIVGGIAVIGIIAYLYNKKKKDDALKMATTANQPSVLNADNTINANSFNFTDNQFPPLTKDDLVKLISQFNQSISNSGLEATKLLAQETSNLDINSTNPRVVAFAKASQFILSKLP